MTVSIPLQTLFANTAAGPRYQTTSAGGIEAVAANNTRTAHWRGGKPYFLFEPSRTNRALHNRDLTNAAWVKTNMTAARTSVGVDGAANSATRITATAGNATVLQTITHASTARAMSAYIKRVTGTGTIEMTMDNGATWTAVTATAAYTRVTIPTQTLANPVIGFRIVTSGDAIDVDVVQVEDGAFVTSSILTSGSAVIRAADNATCSTATFPIDQNGGSIEFIGRADHAVSGSGESVLVQVDDGTNDNAIVLYINNTYSRLGVEVVVNGVSQSAVGPELGPGTASATGWINIGNSTASSVDGRLRLTQNTAAVSARAADYQLSGLVIGRAYVARVSTTAFVGTGFYHPQIAIFNSSGTTEIARDQAAPGTTAKDMEVIFVATETNHRVRLRWDSSTTVLNDYVDFENLEVKEYAVGRPYTSGAEFHVLLTFEQDNVFISLDGANSTPDTTASFPTGLLTTWRWGQDAAGAKNTASVLINRIATHSHEFSTTAANTITG